MFGGTILSIVALAAVTLFNNVNSNIAELRSELTRTQAELNRSNAEIRGELNRVPRRAIGCHQEGLTFNSRMTTGLGRHQEPANAEHRPERDSGRA